MKYIILEIIEFHTLEWKNEEERSKELKILLEDFTLEPWDDVLTAFADSETELVKKLDGIMLGFRDEDIIVYNINTGEEIFFETERTIKVGLTKKE